MDVQLFMILEIPLYRLMYYLDSPELNHETREEFDIISYCIVTRCTPYGVIQFLFYQITLRSMLEPVC